MCVHLRSQKLRRAGSQSFLICLEEWNGRLPRKSGCVQQGHGVGVNLVFDYGISASIGFGSALFQLPCLMYVHRFCRRLVQLRVNSDVERAGGNQKRQVFRFSNVEVAKLETGIKRLDLVKACWLASLLRARGTMSRWPRCCVSTMLM